MRKTALVAIALLIAGCSHTAGGGSGHTHTTIQAAAETSIAAAAPSPGAPITELINWIEAGHPADMARYHTAVRDGMTAQLGTDVAFSAPGSKANCTTDAKHTGSALACLIELTNPPPQPETAYGAWNGGWVDFDGTNLLVGSARADPGPFINGNGTELANGDSVSFDGYRCRADRAGLFCVNYAHQSAARFSSGGVEPYGCLRSAPAPDGVGIAFNCS